MMRIGHGYDAHRLVSGRALILGGVAVPSELGLLGHSDADVLVHALMDALLGAAALGDIGKLFPDGDEAFKGISSIKLLRKVKAVLDAAGYAVSNADCTIIAQRPKLAPFIEQMRQNIADALETPVESISVKATTEEKMGFTGACEGIAAHAVALILKK
ncbi:MAG: 2-C-methyl-D-erythritol 2,4-cyclodiphosphate synthase [Oscillospiraceae bacterium]